ncbi:MAG TPA: hypothetical protein VIF57_09625 [Polyangia bacterium]|jgi:hypothetical protein
MEISVRGGFRSVEDVEQQRARIAAALDTIPKDQLVVIAADWRKCQLMSPAAATAMGVMIGDFNARIERSAILGSPSAPVAVLQFLRVVRESRHPARRVYEERAPMLTWLGERLTDAERERLIDFILPARDSGC